MKRDRPSFLYKYISPSRAEFFLQNPTLRFSPPSDLNDIFEANAPIKIGLAQKGYWETPEGISNMRSALEEEIKSQSTKLSRKERRKLEKSIPSIFSQEASKIEKEVQRGADSERMARSLRDANEKGIGILSLSEVFSSLLMWAYYCQNHQGIVIGLDIAHDFFMPKKNEIISLGVRKVSYSQERPVISLADLSTKLSEDSCVAEGGARDVLFFSKGIDWAYEHEWRIVVKGIQKTSPILDGKGKEIYGVVPVPIAAVKSIYLGCRSSDALKKSAQTFCKANSIACFQAKPHSDQFELIFESVSL